MKIVTAAAFALLLASGVPALADEHIAPTLADMLVGMQHFPSAEQKATLGEIAADEQVDEDLRIIAGAISNIEHQVPEDEQPALQAIIDDDSAGEAAKTLARAALGFNHQLSAEDKEALLALGE